MAGPCVQPSPLRAGISFSRDGRYLALAERRDCKDYVSIFVCSDWQLLRVSASVRTLSSALVSEGACCLRLHRAPAGEAPGAVVGLVRPGAEWVAGQREPVPFRPVPWHVPRQAESGLSLTRPPWARGSAGLLLQAGDRQAGTEPSGTPSELREASSGESGARAEPHQKRLCCPAARPRPRTSGHSGACQREGRWQPPPALSRESAHWTRKQHRLHNRHTSVRPSVPT